MNQENYQNGFMSLSTRLHSLNDRMHHLDRLIGQHMRAFDHTLSRTNGVKIAQSPVSKVEKMMQNSVWENAASDLLGTQQQKKILSIMLNDKNRSQDLGMSQGQIYAEVASAISKAMRRNL